VRRFAKTSAYIAAPEEQPEKTKVRGRQILSQRQARARAPGEGLQVLGSALPLGCLKKRTRSQASLVLGYARPPRGARGSSTWTRQ
jgi:hypothetical protein